MEPMATKEKESTEGVRVPAEMPNFGRDEFVYLARVAEQTEQYEDMMNFVKEFIKLDADLKEEERTIFATAYKNGVGNKRAELRVLTALEQKEDRKGAEVNSQVIKKYKSQISAELKKLCNEVIGIIEKSLLPKSKSSENRIYYFKMCGDYYRYLSEFPDEDEYDEVVEKAEKNYEEAKNSSLNLLTTNPIRLGLDLNRSVFYYEIVQNPSKAVKIAEEAFQAALQDVDKVKEEDYKECTFIMQLLRDNITLWTAEINGEEG